jgi:molecular chaperone GrpE
METSDQRTANVESPETGEEERIEPTADVASSGPDYESLRMMYEDAVAKSAEAQDQVLRTHAELENIRRRGERELEKARKYALESFFQELLPVRDSLEMAIQAAGDSNAGTDKLKEGVEITLRMVDAAMAKFGLKEVNPLNAAFNPELHQAMAVQESAEHPANTVIAVYQKGFVLNDRLIRPARVVVSKVVVEPGGAEKGGGKGDSEA